MTSPRWFLASRPWSFPASVVPVLVGGAVAFDRPGFSAAVFLATLAGAVLVHAGANLANTYFDFNNRLDTPEHSDDRALVDGWFKPAAILRASLALFALSAAIGIFLCIKAGPPMLAVGIAGILLAYFYTGGKIRYKYRGLGEAGIFLCFGPFLVVGTVLIQTGEIVSWAAFFSVPIGLHVAAILHVNNMRDCLADKEAGAVTLAQRLGTRDSIRLYFLLVFGPYLLLLAALPFYSIWLILPVLSLPFARRLFLGAKNNDLSLLPQKTAQFIPLFGILLIIGILL